MIRLISPGGAGKSTVGAVLAPLLALPFLDLDRSFSEEHGDIDRFSASHGYHAYARTNVEVYRGEWKVVLNLFALAAFVALWKGRRGTPSKCSPVGTTAESGTTIAHPSTTEGM